MGPGSKYAYLVHAVRKLKPGEVYVAAYGDEFTCKPTSFQGTIHQIAASCPGGWKATTTVVGTSVFYAFYRRSDYMKPNLPACPVVKKAKSEN